MLPTAASIQIILPILSILFLLLSFKRNIYGVIAYFIILNAKLGDMYPSLGAIRFEFLAAGIVFLSIFLRGNFTAAFPKSHALNKSFWLLFLVGMLSMIQAIDLGVSWENGGYNLIKLALFYTMVVVSVRDRADLEKLLWAFVLVTAWIAYEPVSNYLLGLGERYGYGEVGMGRFGAASGHVALANTLNQCLPIAFFLAASQKNKLTKALLFGIMLLLILGVIFSKSRGGFVGLCVVGAGLVYFSQQKAKALMIAGVLSILILGYSGTQYITHMESITQGVHGSRSANDRYIGLLNGISMMIKRPILGVGIGCYPEARRRYFNYYFYAHNLYGELLGELGLASMAWFYWIYRVFQHSRRLRRHYAEQEDETNLFYDNILKGIQLSLIVRLVLGNFSHCAFIWFWFLMAALVLSIDKVIESAPQATKNATVCY
jgi:hypothetical protein